MTSLIRFFVAALLFFAVSGCKKKYTCSYNYYYVSEHIAFTGYTAVELKQVVISRYKKGGAFAELIGSDTIDASGAAFTGDTAYASISEYTYGSFFDVQNDTDYRIKVLSIGREYTISLNKGGESEIWEQEEHCSPGAGQARIVPYSIILDDRNYLPSAPFTNNWFIYLAR